MPDGQSVKEHAEGDNYSQMGQNIHKSAAFQHYHPHNSDKVANRVNIGYHPCPVRHIVNRSKNASQQYEQRHEKVRDEHRLLLRLGKG